jgi:hypothetical protein
MQATAEAMGCKFVYAIVPPGRIEDIVMAQARKKATAIVGTASKHMALESQTLPNDKIAREIERLTQEIAREMPPDFCLKEAPLKRLELRLGNEHYSRRENKGQGLIGGIELRKPAHHLFHIAGQIVILIRLKL